MGRSYGTSGGRGMAGFASGVIDSFQYFGAGIAGVGVGDLFDRFAVPVATSGVAETVSHAAKLPTVINPTVWFAAMLPWGILGAGLMTFLWLRYRGTDARGT